MIRFIFILTAIFGVFFTAYCDEVHFKWGGTRLKVFLDAGYGFDDNIFIAKTNKESDSFYLIAPGFSLASDTRTGMNLALDYQFSWNDYQKYSDQDFVGHELKFTLNYPLGEFNQFDFSSSLNRDRSVVDEEINLMDVILTSSNKLSFNRETSAYLMGLNLDLSVLKHREEEAKKQDGISWGFLMYAGIVKSNSKWMINISHHRGDFKNEIQNNRNTYLFLSIKWETLDRLVFNSEWGYSFLRQDHFYVLNENGQIIEGSQESKNFSSPFGGISLVYQFRPQIGFLLDSSYDFAISGRGSNSRTWSNSFGCSYQFAKHFQWEIKGVYQHSLIDSEAGWIKTYALTNTLTFSRRMLKGTMSHTFNVKNGNISLDNYTGNQFALALGLIW